MWLPFVFLSSDTLKLHEENTPFPWDSLFCVDDSERGGSVRLA
jgi:hypothetical protein